jgi:hypothetical protein
MRGTQLEIQQLSSNYGDSSDKHEKEGREQEDKEPSPCWHPSAAELTQEELSLSLLHETSPLYSIFIILAKVITNRNWILTSDF